MDEKEMVERLVRVETKMDSVIKNLTNHLRHHWAVELMLGAALVGAAIKYAFFS